MDEDAEYSEDVGADAGETTVAVAEEASTAALDPRVLLATWANDKDEWVRSIVGEVSRVV